MNSPLSVNHPAFPKEKTKWINQTGLHVGLDNDDNSVIFTVRIRLAFFLSLSIIRLTVNRPFKEMKAIRKQTTFDCLTTVMDWTLCVPEITLNAVSYESTYFDVTDNTPVTEKTTWKRGISGVTRRKTAKWCYVWRRVACFNGKG